MCDTTLLSVPIPKGTEILIPTGGPGRTACNSLPRGAAQRRVPQEVQHAVVGP